MVSLWLALGFGAPSAARADTFVVDSADDPGDGLCEQSGDDTDDRSSQDHGEQSGDDRDDRSSQDHGEQSGDDRDDRSGDDRDQAGGDGEGCTLREAIEAANSASGDDRIEFDFPGRETVTIRPQTPLPGIFDSVEIDGSSHSARSRDSGVELDGRDAGSAGLELFSGQSTVRGLAINRFSDGGLVLFADDTTVVGNHIGTDPSGDEARPNGGEGISVFSTGNLIGGTNRDERNVISGNEGHGVFIALLLDGDEEAARRQRERERSDSGNDRDEGKENGRRKRRKRKRRERTDDDGSSALRVARPAPPGWGPQALGPDVFRLQAGANQVLGNRIGSDADGEDALGNQEAGVALEPLAFGTAIGDGTREGGNVIAFNGGDGIALSGDGVQGTRISRNSIFANEGLGIALDDDEPTIRDDADVRAAANAGQNAPELESARTDDGHTRVEGRLAGTPTVEYVIELFGSGSCDPSGAGEGKRFLGAVTVVTGDSDDASFSTDVDEAPEGSEITATATNADTGDTSEFSNCESTRSRSRRGRGRGGGDGGGDNDGDGGGQGSPVVPAPGTGLIASLVSGTVYIKVPGAPGYRLLGTDELIPVGSSINAINGRVRITSPDESGQIQSSEFFSGSFVVTRSGVVAAQAGGTRPVIDIRLIGGDFSRCGVRAGTRSLAREAQAPRPPRRLWGKGRGRFRTRGRSGAATVRGTLWLTVDLCTGTLFVVKEGVITVYDQALRRTVTVRAGQSYFARSRRAR